MEASTPGDVDVSGSTPLSLTVIGHHDKWQVLRLVRRAKRRRARRWSYWNSPVEAGSSPARRPMVIYVIECKGQNLMWVEKLGFWCRFKKPFGHTWASAVIRHCESMSRGHSAHDPAGLAFKAVVDERPDIKVSQLDEEPNMFRGPK